jgi:hypothetical protein
MMALDPEYSYKIRGHGDNIMCQLCCSATHALHAPYQVAHYKMTIPNHKTQISTH